jgi:hypothetical protein
VVLSSPDIFGGDELREDDMDGTCNDTHKEMINAHTVLARKFQGKRPLGKRRSVWEDSVKLVLKKERTIVWTGLS